MKGSDMQCQWFSFPYNTKKQRYGRYDAFYFMLNVLWATEWHYNTHILN